MAHYAKVLDGTVVNVMVAEAEVFDTYVDTSAGDWIKTSYNTIGGKHTLGGTPLRKNYASIGYTYDRDRDAFIPPQDFPSWTLNEETCRWDPPVPYPKDLSKLYGWVEEDLQWVEMTS